MNGADLREAVEVTLSELEPCSHERPDATCYECAADAVMAAIAPLLWQQTADAQRDMDPRTAARAALAEEIDRLREQVTAQQTLNDSYVASMHRQEDSWAQTQQEAEARRDEARRDEARRDLAAATTTLGRIRDLCDSLDSEMVEYERSHNPDCECEVIPATRETVAKFRAALDATEVTTMNEKTVTAAGDGPHTARCDYPGCERSSEPGPRRHPYGCAFCPL